uniref:Uncharacterized protein n=1 Tax=Balaenoptera musculus TaxID=9771 RepID=A0A8C0CWD7_BALMU
LILKVATGKKLEGGHRLAQGASLGLFCPNTVEARDRSAGLPSKSSSCHSILARSGSPSLFL